MLRAPLDVLQILVAIVAVVLERLPQRLPNTDDPVPWSLLRSSEELRYHERVRCFSLDLEPKYGPSQDTKPPENNSHQVKFCECSKNAKLSTTKRGR